MAAEHYTIVANALITEESCGCCIQTSVDTVRHNNADTQGILKWDGETPECLEGQPSYAHLEVLSIISNPAKQWIRGVGGANINLNAFVIKSGAKTINSNAEIIEE